MGKVAYPTRLPYFAKVGGNLRHVAPYSALLPIPSPCETTVSNLLAGPELSHFSCDTGAVSIQHPLPDGEPIFIAVETEASTTSEPFDSRRYANISGPLLHLLPFGFWPYEMQHPYSFRSTYRYSAISLHRMYRCS